jgi:putative hemolysin
MTLIVLEIAIIGSLLGLNAVFSMSEMAIVSARRARLSALANEGNRGAAEAIAIADAPTKFLSTVQIGITLIGILSGAFGGATLSGQISQHLVFFFPMLSENVAKVLGVSAVVVGITFFSVVLGELVPKRLALQYSESIAAVVSRPMKLLSQVSAPLVWIFSSSTDFILRWLHLDNRSTGGRVTHEEIRAMVEQGQQDGVLDVQERRMINSVLAFGKKRITAIMTPAHEIVFIDTKQSLSSQMQRITGSHFSTFPVVEGSLDHILGTVYARDVCKCSMEKNVDIASATYQPLYIPESTTALQVLEQFQETGSRIGFVVDEFGSVEGLVTITDIARAIVGDVPVVGMQPDSPIVKRSDGSLLMDGDVSIEDLKETLKLGDIDGDKENLFQTLAGFVMHRLGRVPKISDSFSWGGWRFEVVDMDKNRVDKVLVSLQANSLPVGHHVPSGPTTQPTK